MKIIEYNEAVEKLALIILNARRIKEGLDKVESFEGFYKDDVEMNLFIAKIAIDALGVEIVTKDTIPLACDNYEGTKSDGTRSGWSFRIFTYNNKPAVYLENIKGAE